MAQQRLMNMTPFNVDYKPIVYDGGKAYEGFTPDMSLQAQNIARTEARRKEATEKQTAIDLALGNIEDKLNAEELPWFNEYKANIQQQIQDEVDAGAYGSAIRVATRLAGQVASDTAIKNRIKSNTKYQETLKTVLTDKKIDDVTKQRWQEENAYSNEDIVANGQVVGGKEWEANWMPTENIDWENTTHVAFKLVSPETHASKRTNADGTGGGSSYQRVPLTKILENLEYILSTTARQDQIEQEFQDARYRKRKIQEELDSLNPEDPNYFVNKNRCIERLDELNKVLRKGDAEVDDYKTFFERKLTHNVLAANLAYDNRTSDVDLQPRQTNTEGLDNETLESEFNDDSGRTVEGNPTQKKSNSTRAANETERAANKARGLFTTNENNSTETGGSNGVYVGPGWGSY